MSDDPTSKPTLSRRERASKPAAERQLIMKNLFVGHDRFTDAMKAISRFHMPVEVGVPDFGSLFILGGIPRTGKSFVLKRYARKFPVDTGGEQGLERPVAYVDLPVSCNKHSFADALASGLNANHGSNTGAVFGNALNALLKQKVQLLILDEVQEAFDTSRPTALKECQGLVRKILNLGTLNVVAGGLMETYALMAANEQLQGRGLLPHHIVLPYEWENQVERDLYRLLCAEIDLVLPFEAKSGLGSPWFAVRLHWVTNGIIGALKDFVYYAGCIGLNQGAAKLEAEHFAEAWDHIRPVGMTFNPFRHDMDQAPARREQAKPALQPKDPTQDAYVK